MDTNKLSTWCDNNDYSIIHYDNYVYRLEHDYNEFITQIIYVDISRCKVVNGYVKRESNLFFVKDDIHELFIPLNNVKRDADLLEGHLKNEKNTIKH